MTNPEREMLTTILLQMGETRKGVENLEIDIGELKVLVNDLNSSVMRREECQFLHDKKDPHEKAQAKLHKLVSTIAALIAVFLFCTSVLVGSVKISKYVEQMDSLQKRTSLFLQKAEAKEKQPPAVAPSKPSRMLDNEARSSERRR